MTGSGNEPLKNLGQLLSEPYAIFAVELHRELATAGYGDIHPTHGNNVFRHLRAEGSRITELAERAQLTKQTMGYLVDYLEERGYVQRVPDPADGRARIICLTERGWKATRVAEGIIRRIELDWSRRFGEDRMSLLRHLLDGLSHIFEEESAVR